MTDQETISVYDAQVQEYAEIMRGEPVDQKLLRFIARLDRDDYVLDLGCGPADASALMREHGLRVDPVDASQAMVDQANRHHAIGARRAVFEDIDGCDIYHGVWASFSLLHARADELPAILAAIKRATRAGGPFFLGMKLGSGSHRDALGRRYSYYSQDDLCRLLDSAGFQVEEIETGEAVGLAGQLDAWIGITSVCR